MARATTKRSQRKNLGHVASEPLEARVLLSNVTVAFKNGNLTLKGDDQDNTVSITPNGMGGLAVRGENGTTIEGSPDPFPIDALSIQKNVKLLFNQGGNNVVFLNAPVGGSVVYKGGAGDDSLGLADVTVGKNVSVKTGDGADIVGVLESTVEGSIKLNLGNGDDKVGMENTSVLKNLAINSGNDNDDIGVLGGTISGKATVKTGNGDDGMYTEGTTYSGKVNLNMGGGNDDAIADATFGGAVVVNGGSGEDNGIAIGVFSSEPKVTGFEGFDAEDRSGDLQACILEEFADWIGGND